MVNRNNSYGIIGIMNNYSEYFIALWKFRRWALFTIERSNRCIAKGGIS